MVTQTLPLSSAAHAAAGGGAAGESRPVLGLAFRSRDPSANRGAARLLGAILVGFVAVPVSDRRVQGRITTIPITIRVLGWAARP